MQVSDLYAEIGRLCGDPGNTRWVTSLLLTRLNFAQLDVQKVAGPIKAQEALTTVANTATVGLSANLIDVKRVQITDSSGNISPLKGTTLTELWYRRPLYLNETATLPDSYYIDYTNQQINFIPKPDQAYSFTVWEVQQVTSLALSTDIPFNSNNLMVPYHMVLAYWVTAQNLMDNNDSDSLQKSLYFRSENLDKPGKYESLIKQIQALFDAPTDEWGRILWKPAGGRLGGWPVSKSTPLG